mgnify:FL=1
MDGAKHCLPPELSLGPLTFLKFIYVLHPGRAQRGCLSIDQLVLLILIGILPAKILAINCEPAIGFWNDADSLRVIGLATDVLLLELQVVRDTKLVLVTF